MIPSVRATAVAVPGLDLEAVRRLAEQDLGVAFHVRAYNVVG
jgi:TatD DNase family protein